jgi:thiamine-phosphate pyrophosphorylase
MGFITVATHTNDEVERALALGADGVLVSPIFETPGAGKGSPRGVAALEAAARELEGRREKHAGAHAMIYGLGGIDASRARACAEAGAHGVAVIRAIFESNDPAKEAVAMWEALEKHSR